MVQTKLYVLIVSIILALMCMAGVVLEVYTPHFAWGLFGSTWLVGAVVCHQINKTV